MEVKLDLMNKINCGDTLDLMKNIDKKSLNEVLRRNAILNVGKLEDVSHTIDWLIDPKSNAITGQIIYLGGV